MTLRIIAPTPKAPQNFNEPAGSPAAPAADGWADRLAKLIPAEALGLYGAGSNLVPAGQKLGLYILAAVCLVFSGTIRYFATRGQTGQTQWTAVAIAMVSFALWLLTLKPPSGPFDLGQQAYLATLFALIWATFTTTLYKG